MSEVDMSTDVVMPQMGESIAEGTIVRWIKKVGESVERDEPLFEISTDKVDAEIPSPVAGVVTEIRAAEGQTVPVNSVVAVIGQTSSDTGAGRPPSQDAGAAPPPEKAPSTGTRPAESAASKPASTTSSMGSSQSQSADEAVRERSSPLVRRIAKEHGVDISQVRGTGIAGRVTKEDLLAHIALQEQTGPPTPVPSAHAEPRTPDGPGRRMEPMSVMRKKIAEHMVGSLRTSAHVHTVFEVNFERVSKVREGEKARYEQAGVKLTFLSFIVKAAADALQAVPILNASVDGDKVIYHDDVNIGVAVALDWGLIVPVIRNANEKDLLGLSRAIADLADRARTKRLRPDEVSDGTFTVTNPGVSGALFGTPIINQPQVAILGVGSIERRPVVIDDKLMIKPTAHLSLGFDHRLIDGAIADQFMTHVKRTLENWPAS
jgi:2-oxoglutarate dehydrogenase E2 component (dihydrolipoamide succinyltransferase)